MDGIARYIFWGWNCNPVAVTYKYLLYFCTNFQSTIILDGDNKLVHQQKIGSDTLQIIREFKGDEMIMQLTAPPGAEKQEIKSTRIYQKI